MVKARHVHHLGTVPLGGFAGAYIMFDVLSDKATELTEKAEVTQACLDLIRTILSVFN